MDISTILGPPSVSVSVHTPDNADTERPVYLQPDGAKTGTMMGDSPDRPRGDPAMTAGAMALVAVAGLIAMRYAFRGALK